MNGKFVVVDGSNLATEGRSSPSLVQLDEAVREFQQQFPDRQVIVVVDATFGHRIDSSERKAFDEAIAHGEVVSPPAGAIGRGDAFLLRIAERVKAQVLSNDSFQEFHTDHPWLFDEGRLIGGTPVPGVGWIFTPRTPVRSHGRATKAALSVSSAETVPKKSSRTTQAPPAAKARKTSKRATAEEAAKTEKQAKKAQAKKAQAKRAPAKQASKGAGAKKAETAEKAPKAAAKKAPKTKKANVVAKKTAKTQGKKAARAVSSTRRPSSREVDAAIERATEEVLVPPDQAAPAPARGRGRGRRRAAPSAVNDPITFLEFVSEHPIGSRVEGKVTSFMSHGAMVDVGEMHCYVPLKGLALRAPGSAREVLKLGEARTFVLVGLDAPRRGAELALPEVATGRARPRKKTT